MAANPEIIFRGHGVSPGVVWGRALKIDSHNRVMLKVEVADPEAEVARFMKAIEIRLRKLSNAGLKRDEQAMATIEPLWKRDPPRHGTNHAGSQWSLLCTGS